MPQLSSNTKRRTVIKSIGGISVAAAMAGCLGDDSDDDDGNGVNDTGDDSDDGDDDPVLTENADLLIGWGEGGGWDTYGRVTADHMEDHLPISFLPENQSGAGGMIAMEAIANAEPDGYTTGVLAPTAIISENLLDDPPIGLGDFEWFGRMGISEHAVFAKKGGDFETIDDIINADGSVLFGGTGPTSGLMITTYIMADFAGFDIDLVTGYSTPEMVTALLADDIEAATIPIGSALPAVIDDEVEMLLAFSDEPIEAAPDAPIAIDTQFEEIAPAIGSHRILGTTAGVSDAQLAVYREAFDDAVTSDAYANALAEREQPVHYMPWDEIDDALDEQEALLSEYQSVIQDFVAEFRDS